MLGRNWREEVRRRWGIEVLAALAPPSDCTLWVSRCSRVKGDVLCGTPEQLYVSAVNRYFYARMHEFGLRFGVLSDKYGLHLDREKLPSYDIHPSVLSDDEKKRLGQLILRVAQAEGYARVAFYNPSPLMSVPYFEMLYYSGLSVVYTTRLPAHVSGLAPTAGRLSLTQGSTPELPLTDASPPDHVPRLDGLAAGPAWSCSLPSWTGRPGTAKG